MSTTHTMPTLKGRYLFGDFVSGRIWALHLDEHTVQSLGRWPVLVSTFGRDLSGAVYVGGYGRGALFRIEPAP